MAKVRGDIMRDESSGEEDGDSEWKKAISSVADATSSYINAANPSSTDAVADHRRDHKPKHYQIKVQKLLDDILEKSLVMVNDNDENDNDNHGVDINVPDSNQIANSGGAIRLFKNSTPGLLIDYTDEPQQPPKRPKILPGEEINEKSKKFKRRLKSVAVDGKDIMAAAKNVAQKSLARKEAKEEAGKEKAKREEERVLELKKSRGERWLPSLLPKENAKD